MAVGASLLEHANWRRATELVAVLAAAVCCGGISDSSCPGGNCPEPQTRASEEPGGGRDLIAPFFAGVRAAELEEDGLSVRLSWSPAIDDRTPYALIEYLIFVSDETPIALGDAPLMTVRADSAAPSRIVADLEPATRYFFVIRARDAAGNVDGNRRELSVVTKSP